MVARVRTVAFSGVDVVDVEAQVTITPGLPAFAVVGLPDKTVAESRERVRSALAALGLSLPSRHITVNLAPADVLKEGSHFDLPIALALLAAMDVLPEDELAGYTALGEVALDGSLTSVAGVLLAALTAAARQSGSSAPLLAAAKPPGPARSRSSPPRTFSRSSIISRARNSCRRPSRSSRRREPPGSTSRTSKARRAPSARSKSPRRAVITCSRCVLYYP